MDVADILVISGLPGTGKTHYTKWLESLGWGCLRSDESPHHPGFLSAVGGDDTALLREASRFEAGFVLEWGIPASCLPQVRAMIGRGYNAWYFDGDRDAARSAWSRAWGLPEEGWYPQANSLAAASEEIWASYGHRIIRTIERGPIQMPPREIHRLIGLALALRAGVAEWPSGISGTAQAPNARSTAAAASDCMEGSTWE